MGVRLAKKLATMVLYLALESTILRGVKGGMGGSCGQGSSAARKQKVIQNIGFQNISRHFYKLILTFLMSFLNL